MIEQLVRRGSDAEVIALGYGTLAPGETARSPAEDETLGMVLVFGTEMFDSAKARGKEPRGSIVDVSSMAATRAPTRVAGYGAAKAALEGLTRSLAVELARSCGPGLRVRLCGPGAAFVTGAVVPVDGGFSAFAGV